METIVGLVEPIMAVAVMATACTAAFAILFVSLFPRLSFLESAFMAPGIGLTASAWIALIVKSLPMMRIGIKFEVVVVTLAVQSLITWRLLGKVRGLLAKHRQRISDELRANRFALIMLGVMSVWWYYMSSIHYLLPRGSDYLAGGSVYADLPFHLNLSTSFLNGCNENATIFSSLMSSFYAGATLAYPFIPDFYLSVLVAGGMTLRQALVGTGWVLLTALFSLLYAFNARVTGSQRAGLFSVWLTLFAGGIGGFYYIRRQPDWWTVDNLTNSKFMHGPDHVLYWVDGMSAFWFSLPAHILFPQRTVQHAYPLALSALLLLWAGMTKRDSAAAGTKGTEAVVGKKSDDIVPGAVSPRIEATPYLLSEELFTRGFQARVFAAAGLVAGLIPLTQPHSFASIGIVALVAAGLGTAEKLLAALCSSGASAAARAAAYPRKPVSPWVEFGDWVLGWTAFGVLALVTGLPQFFKHFFHRVTFGVGTRGNGFVRWSAAWQEEGKGETWWYMWWKALGLFGPCYALAFFLLRRNAQRYLYLGFLTLFVTCNLVMFQPWHLDNTKLLYVWVFGASGAVGLFIDTILSLGEGAASRLLGAARGAGARAAALPVAGVLRLVTIALATALYIALTFSGTLATWREMLNYAKLYDDIDFDLAHWITHNTPPDAIFLHDISQDNHIRVESSLAGRQVAHGFNGWLNSHGINNWARRADLLESLRGGRNGVAALARHNISYITVDAAYKRGFNYAFLDDVADLVATNGKFTIYRILPEVREGWAMARCRAAGGDDVSSDKAECLRAGCWWYDDMQGERCMQKPRQRAPVDCAPGGSSSKESCEGDGCLWMEGYPGPWCQKPRWQQAAVQPALIPALRPGVPGSDCGWHNMSPNDCAKRGCEWRQPDDPYLPWCVYTEGQQQS